METKEMVEKKTSLLQKLRKNIYLAFLTKKKALKYDNLSSDLKYDNDVIVKIINILEEEDCEELSVRHVFESILKDNPSAIINFNETKVNWFIDRVKSINIESEETKFIKFLSADIQKNIMLRYPNAFNEYYQNFSEQAIIETFLEDKQNRKNNRDLSELSSIDIKKLSLDVQLKIGLIDSNFIKSMSEDAQIKFYNNNPFLINYLNDNVIKSMLEKDFSLARFLENSRREGEVLEYIRSYVTSFQEDNFKKLKSMILNGNIDYYWITRNTTKPEMLLEIAKFKPDIDFNFEQENILKEYIVNNHEFEEFHDLLQNRELSMNKIRNILKIGSNEDIMKTVDIDKLKEYIKNPEREKLLEIIELTYGKQAKGILDERPNIDIDEIPNLYIFNPKVIDEFSIGAVHNFLSYKNMGASIVSDLTKHPELMKKYKKFDDLTQDYYGKKVLDLEKKLIAFSDLSELLENIDEKELTEKQKNNLLLFINDKYTEPSGINPVEIQSLNELQEYDEIRKRRYDEAIEKSSDPIDIKQLIFKKIFGIYFYHSEGITQSNVSSRDIVNRYNIKKFIDSPIALQSGIFSQDELDCMELLSIIYNINDTKVLKKISESLSKTEKDVINPVSFKDTKEKIPLMYQEDLLNTVWSPQKALEKAKGGKDNISYEEKNGMKIVKLKGINFSVYVSDINSLMSNVHGAVKGWSEDQFKRWTTFENGVSTISGCVWDQNNISLISKTNETSGNFYVGFSNIDAEQILGMGYDDINVTHMKRQINPEFRASTYEYDSSSQLTKKNRLHHNKNGPEVTILRREQNVEKIKEGTYGGRIMPTYIFGSTNNEDLLISQAKQFGIDTIIEIELDAYKDKEMVQESKENSEKPKNIREETSFIKEIKEMAEADGRE